MSSVTSRVKEVVQPRGGYIKPSMFSKTVFDDGIALEENENVHASIVGMAVDYMTSFMMLNDAEEAFKVSLLGYDMRIDFLSGLMTDKDVKKSGILKYEKNLTIEQAKRFLLYNEDDENCAFNLVDQINGLDDDSIIAACKLVTYDVWYRNTSAAMLAKGAEDINPDKNTINNIRVMVKRSLAFWEKAGPLEFSRFIFSEFNEDGEIIKSGYTKTVDSGDGDYLTNDTMWDFKVSKSEPTNKHTLQILMYYIMGKHSGMEIYKNVENLGFFNPRLNAMYVLNIKDVPIEIIREVEKDVICY